MCIKIITDSACDLPKNIIEEFDIELMPILVYLDDVEHRDTIDIQPKFLYDKMREGSSTKTAQLSMASLREVFLKYAKSNQSCIYIAFSSGLSGTYQTSLMVKEEILEEYPEFDLTIVDTKCASTGFGLIVYKAVQLVKDGKSKDEILEAIDFYCEHMDHIFTVDDLEYLYRGGRVSRASAVIGGMLNIKPILTVDDGKLVPIEKVRGKKKLIKRMIELIGERGKCLDNQLVSISHGDDEEAALKIRDILKEKYNCKSFIITYIGCTIGSHTGPGGLTVSFLNEKSPY
ncbi:DegV family protein [Clostridiaceae bacterium M8S5]|nr:DegV family protein [Clostridiaceae bacterium M8S5]